MSRSVLFSVLLFFYISGSCQDWTESQKIVASDRTAYDQFGVNVSLSQDFAVVGAQGDDEDENGGNFMDFAGSAYIFEKESDGVWAEVQKICASDREEGARFGSKVSISGNYAAIGAYGEDKDVVGDNPMMDAGAVYIFKKSGSGDWVQTQKICASDRSAEDMFGISVSINGELLIVGAHYEDEDSGGGNHLFNAGSAYIFERDADGKWNEVEKLSASDRDSRDLFGTSVSVHGNFAVVGAAFEDEDPSGGNTINASGSAYIFECDTTGHWSQTQKICASDRGEDDTFANSLALYGNYLVVGSIWENEDPNGVNTVNDAGSAYIFKRDNDGSWNQIQKICSADRDEGDAFGRSCAMYENYIVVGAWFDDQDPNGGNYMENSGAAYIFEKNEDDYWGFVQKVCSSDRDENDQYGGSVSVFGEYIIVGAEREREDTAGINYLSSAGSAYIIKSCNSTSSLTITACNSYIVPSGHEIYTESGIYLDTIPNTIGCDSIITIDLTILTLDTSVSVDPPTLTSNASGVEYQWFDCDAMEIIEGETFQSYTATTTGNYAVIITDDICTDTSLCYFVDLTFMEETAGHDQVNLFPNPTNGEVNLEFTNTYKDIVIEMYTGTGTRFFSQRYESISKFNHIIDGPPGIYFILLKPAGNKNRAIKVIKMKY